VVATVATEGAVTAGQERGVERSGGLRSRGRSNEGQQNQDAQENQQSAGRLHLVQMQETKLWAQNLLIKYFYFHIL
jgi:hypothetical protein